MYNSGRHNSVFAVAASDPSLTHRRELIPDGETGGLVIFDDTPNFWDAWGRPI